MELQSKSANATDRNQWLEVTSAIVLSLATTASAWCAYQATLWNGVQTFNLAAANDANRRASAATFAAMLGRAFDASMIMSYLEATTRGDDKMERVLHQRFRPEAKLALDAWLKTDPLNDPSAPLNPLKLPEYVQPELQEAQRQNDLAAEKQSSAHQASKHADRYVLLTVLFASVLFFGGIGGTFKSERLRISVLVIALVLFAGTIFALGNMPSCRE
jgi:hypothetical protein